MMKRFLFTLFYVSNSASFSQNTLLLSFYIDIIFTGKYVERHSYVFTSE